MTHPPSREFELNLHRVIVRAIKYGNFVEIDTFFMQLKHSLSNKRRLL